MGSWLIVGSPYILLKVSRIMNAEDLRRILNDLDRKLFLLKGEKSIRKRDEIIDSILSKEDGEIAQLEIFLKRLRRKNDSS